jgi:AcrR family transcriptional regulator
LEVKNKIIEVADMLFMKYGLRSVSMDDIARESSVSKKTIYQYYQDKDELVELVTQKYLNLNKEEFEWINNDSSNAIEQLKRASICMRRNLETMPPSLLYELNKYHSKAWKCYLDFKDKVIFEHIKLVLSRGIKEGFFRSEINAEILAIIRIEQVSLCFDHTVFPREKFDFRTVQYQVFDHFVHGLLTDKGREEWKKETLN